MESQKAKRIKEYLTVSQRLLNERIFENRRPAEALVGKVTYHQQKGKSPIEGVVQKDVTRVSELMGQKEFFERLAKKWTEQGGKSSVSMIIGDSGLGKTWLMASLFQHISGLWITGSVAPVPFLTSLTGQNLMGNDNRLLVLRQSFKEKGFTQEQIQFALEQMTMPPETSAGQRLMDLLLRDTGFRELDANENILVLLDAVNEMPDDGKRNLQTSFVELMASYPNWHWVISGQPQTVEEVSWIKAHRPLLDEQGKSLSSDVWDFYEVQEVSEERVRGYLNIHLGEGRYRELEDTLLGYLREFDYSIRRNPRYLYHICERLQKTGDVKALPNTAGKLLDEVVTAALVEGIPTDKATADEITTRKTVLGCIGLYEVLSGGELLCWERDLLFPERDVKEWLRGFAKAGVFSETQVESTLVGLRSRGPWRYGADNSIVFDHDTTRDYAVASVFKHLLENWRHQTHEGFREFLVMLLGSNRFLRKSVKMVMELVSKEETLELAKKVVELVEDANENKEQIFLPSIRRRLLKKITPPDKFSIPSYVDRVIALMSLANIASYPEVENALIERLSDEEQIASVAISTLKNVTNSDRVRNTLKTRLRDLNGEIRRSAAEALGSAVSDPTIKEALMNRLKDDEIRVQIAAIKSLASVADRGIVKTLIDMMDNQNYDWFKVVGRTISQISSDRQVKKLIVKMLTDQRPKRFYAATIALADATKESEVKNALVARLNDRNNEIRKIATETLGPIAKDPAVRDALLKMMADKNHKVRYAAAGALAHETNNKYVQEALFGSLSDKNSDVRSAVTVVLSFVAAKAPIRDALIKIMIEDKSPKVRYYAALSLARIANEDGVAKKALVKRLGDRNSNVRWIATKALGSVSNDPNIRNALISRLTEDKISKVRHAAVEAVSRYTNEVPVQEILLRGLSDKNRDVWKAALNAFEPVADKLKMPIAVLPKLRDYRLFRAALNECFTPLAPMYSFWRGFVWAFSTKEALSHSLTFYMNPQAFLSVVKTIPKIDLQLQHYAILDGETRHTSRRTDKQQFFSELKDHFPMLYGRMPCPALCVNGKPVFFNYATFCLSHLVPDIERFELLKDPDVGKTLQEIFEAHVIAAMGFSTGKVSEICEDSELVFGNESVRKRTIFGNWEIFRKHLSNLIANARIHKKKACRVMILDPCDGKVMDPAILILDDGKGFPTDREALATFFKRGKTRGGSGNGLTEDMLKELGEMGFSLCLRNGKGTWFYFEKNPEGNYRLSDPIPIPDPIAGEKKTIERFAGPTGAVVAIMKL